MDQGRGLVAVLVTAIVVAVVALLVGVGLIAVGLVRDDESSLAEVPASSQPSTMATAGDGAACRLRAEEARVTLEPALVTALAVRGIAVEPIAPARSEGDGGVALDVPGDGSLTCDLGAGTLGLRGGLRLAQPDFEVEMRRWRVETDEGLISADFSGLGTAVRRGFSLEPDGRESRREGDRITLVVTLSLREGSAATLDGALSPRAVVDGDPVGTLTIAGVAVERER